MSDSQYFLVAAFVSAPWLIAVIGVLACSNFDRPDRPVIGRSPQILLLVLGVAIALAGYLIHAGIIEDYVHNSRGFGLQYKIVGLLVILWAFFFSKRAIVRLER